MSASATLRRTIASRGTRAAAVLVILAAAPLAAACDPSAILGDRGQPVPSGAQQVHVTITNSAIHLTPDTVRAGVVYLVVDAPPDGSLIFISGAGPGTPPDAPLAPDGLERLARGDTEGTTISGYEAGGCSEEQNKADRGKTGVCGNVMQVVVSAGTYAIMADAPETNAGRPTPLPIGILTVTP